MLNEDDIKIIKEITQDFFQKTGFEVEIEFLPQNDMTIPIHLKTDDYSSTLIGEKGRTLVEIQHLLKVILKRRINKDFYIDLDINNYKEKKIEYLKELARTMADEVALTKKEKVLPPMPAYERRIIHLELANRTDITSQSIDEEPERRIVIKPYP